MRKLRLLLFEDCDRRCPGCCNNDWDLEKLPVCKDFFHYDQIILTGGEPMLKPLVVRDTIAKIRKEAPFSAIWVYTAKISDDVASMMILLKSDGITVTLHSQQDVEAWEQFANMVREWGVQRILRLNIFKGIDISACNTAGWIVKDDIEWIKDCPLPEGEIFMRLETPNE